MQYFYIPEKVEEAIRAEDEMFDYKLTELDENCRNFKWRFTNLIEYEAEMKIRDDTKEDNDLIYQLIKTCIPEYALAWKYLCGMGDKRALPKLIKEEKDINIRSIYLDVYADDGFVTKESDDNLGIYMEMITDYQKYDKKASLSLFTHIKYMRAYSKVYKANFEEMMKMYGEVFVHIHPDNMAIFANAFTELLNPKSREEVKQVMRLPLGKYKYTSVGVLSCLVRLMHLDNYFYENIIQYQNAMQLYGNDLIINLTYYDKENIEWYFELLKSVVHFNPKLIDFLKLEDRDRFHLRLISGLEETK